MVISLCFSTVSVTYFVVDAIKELIYVAEYCALSFDFRD